jgi:hypothetical protein
LYFHTRFEPFVEACVEHKALGEAAQYIKQLGDPHKQVSSLALISPTMFTFSHPPPAHFLLFTHK